MKTYRSILTILLIIFSVLTIKAQDIIASIDFANPTQENNISLVINTNTSAEAYTKFIEIGGKHCLHVPSTKYGYFRADDATIPSTDSLLTVRIEYYDTGLGDLAFQYNAKNDVNYQRHSLDLTDSKTWATATISLTDASFRNAENNSADFRIHGEVYVRSIKISRGVLDPEVEDVPVTTGSAYSEFKGKSVAGYQAWFTASTNDSWNHWSGSDGPSPGNSSFEVYPDLRDYDADELYQTGYANFGNGEPAKLFSSAEVIDTHFEWMKETGIDGIALQRFISGVGKIVTTVQTVKPILVKAEAEANEKIFYVCYDMSGTAEDWAERIKFDWVFNIEQAYGLTSSPAYATVNNKPVVQVWGPGFTSRLGDVEETLDLIAFLQGRGCYVIGGVPTYWRTESNDSKPGFMPAYKLYDMVSPWTPGRYRTLTDVNNFKNDKLVPDQTFCEANDLDYMPVLFPGFAWSTWNDGAPNHIPRLAGEFLWRQATNIQSLGLENMYFAMFDEYDEGTAIMKGATDWSMIPTDQYFLTLSADGTWVSSDFYLRVAGAATSMLQSTETPSATIDIPYSEGPVYYRNSFEKRYTEYEKSGIMYDGVYNLDACFYRDKQISRNNVTLEDCIIEENEIQSKSGKYRVKMTGTPGSAESAEYSYQISEVNIPVVENMYFSFWKKTITSLGKYVSADLLFESGKRLSQLSSYTNNYEQTMDPSVGIGFQGDKWKQIACKIGEGELLGDVITGIIIAYDHPATEGTFEAHIDDILIALNLEVSIEKPTELRAGVNNRIGVGNGLLNFRDFPMHSQIQIYSITGSMISSFELTAPEVAPDLKNGLYLINVRNKEGSYTQKIVF